MELIFFCISAILITIIFKAVWQGRLISSRTEFIDNYQFPKKIRARVLEEHPHLNELQAERVLEGLREYFHVCNEAGRKFISMPSQAVDTAWHEFILFTREYNNFCTKAFGKFLHHTPAEGMTKPKSAQAGIRTAWRISCARGNINPNSPAKMPMLFAMDSTLDIQDGFLYELNCNGTESQTGANRHCATHITSSGAGCGGAHAGESSSDSGSGCGSGCGGGCGS